MYNALIYNEGQYNAPMSFPVEVQPTTLLQFDGFDLNSASSVDSGDRILIQNLDDNGPVMELDKFDVPRGDGITVNGKFRRGKMIEADGVFFADTGAELEALCDTIKKNLRKMNRPLDVTKYGVTRRYPYATFIGMDKIFNGRKGSDITRCPLRLQFLCTDIAVDWQYTSQVKNISVSEDTDTVNTTATDRVKPSFVIVINAANSMSVLNIQNETTGDEIEITRSFAAGETLIIDCEEQTVTVNGVAVDFVGKFPELEVGESVIRYTVTSTSHDFDATVKHRNGYL